MNPRKSITGALLFEYLQRGQTALSSSTTLRSVRRVIPETSGIAETSRTAGVARWVERVVHTSWFYRLLTAEPEDDVVVIDLRETRTLGPILAAFERVVGSVDRNWDQSRAGAVASRLSNQLATRPVSVVSTTVLVVILTNLLLLVGLGSPSPSAVGMRLVATSLALAGTRVTLSADELTGTRVYALATSILMPPDPPEDRTDPPEK